MTGMLSESQIPSGEMAAAFYRKGSGVDDLTKILETCVCRIGSTATCRRPSGSRNGHDPFGAEFVTIARPALLANIPARKPA